MGSLRPFISTVSTKSPTGSLVLGGKAKRTRCRIESFRVMVSFVVRGYSAISTEPVSRRPTDKTKCPTGLRFRKGREDPVPQEDIISCDNDDLV